MMDLDYLVATNTANTSLDYFKDSATLSTSLIQIQNSNGLLIFT